MPNQYTRPVRRARSLTEALESRLLMATSRYNASLAIPMFDSFDPPTPAELYPSILEIEQVPGTITELRVSLFGVSHERPQDMDLLLVNPAFKSVMIMSDAGGNTPITGEQYADLTFTDTAASTLPTTAITGGVYRPTNYDTDDFFPQDNRLLDAPTHTTLAALAADNPVGTWRLYAVDDTTGKIGSIMFGWGLTFVTNGPGPAAPSAPDLLAGTDTGASNSDNVTRNDRPVFRGTATAGTQVQLFVDGTPLITGPITNGTYTVEAVGLREGTHSVSVRALNAEGTEGPASGDLVVTLDTVRPDLPSTPDLTPESDTGASNTDNDTTDTTPTFTGTVLLNASAVTLYANNEPVGTGTVVNNVYTVTPTEPMLPGTYEFGVVSRDLAGNVSDLTIPGLTVVIRPGGTNTPNVTAVYVRGRENSGTAANDWTADFKSYLETTGRGDDVFGYRVDNLPAGSTLPWVNLYEVVVQYSGPLTGGIPTPANYPVAGERGGGYGVTSVTQLDPLHYLLRLARPLGGGDPATGARPTTTENGDRITLSVPGGGPGGTNYALALNVLQGDAYHADEAGGNHVVNASDFSDVKKRFFKSTTNVGTGDTAYSVFHDVDGNGTINAADFSEVKKRFFQALSVPTLAPAGAFSSTRIADDVLA